MMVQSNTYTFSKSHTSEFKFRSFLWLVIGGMILSCDAGQWQQAAAPSQPRGQGHEGKQPI